MSEREVEGEEEGEVEDRDGGWGCYRDGRRRRDEAVKDG